MNALKAPLRPPPLTARIGEIGTSPKVDVSLPPQICNFPHALAYAGLP